MVRVHDRRSALVRFVTAGVAFISGGLAALVGIAAAPRPHGSGKQWRRTISMFELPPDRPMAAVIAMRQADGWHETRRQTVVFIDREGQDYRALSATCTHLGCRVRWDGGADRFLCPCHGGAYDREGRVVADPPPRSLARLAVRVNPQTSDIEVEL